MRFVGIPDSSTMVVSPRLYRFALLRVPTLDTPWTKIDEKLAREVGIRRSIFVIAAFVANLLFLGLGYLHIQQMPELDSIKTAPWLLGYVGILIVLSILDVKQANRLGQPLTAAACSQWANQLTLAGFEAFNPYLEQAQKAGRQPSFLELWLLQQNVKRAP